MKHNVTEYLMWACSALFGLLFASGAWAIGTPKMVESCTYCHGKGGASTEADVPIIGGYSVDYLIASMTSLKRQERPCPETHYRSGPKKGTKTDMCQVVKDMSANDIKDVARYFSKQKFVRAKQEFDAELAKKGREIHEQRCEKCHTNSASDPRDDAGIQAGQQMKYLEEILFEFVAGTRPVPKKMKAQLEQLDKASIEALVHYYGSFK